MILTSRYMRINGGFEALKNIFEFQQYTCEVLDKIPQKNPSPQVTAAIGEIYEEERDGFGDDEGGGLILVKN